MVNNNKKIIKFIKSWIYHLFLNFSTEGDFILYTIISNADKDEYLSALEMIMYKIKFCVLAIYETNRLG